jgi:hypothetical protein
MNRFATWLAASTLAWAAHGALAQDASNGHTLYTLNCRVCHGAAEQNLFGVLAGANPSIILGEIQAYAPMRFLAPNPDGPITSVSQINDIAAYLAQVAGGGGMPPAPAFSASPDNANFGSVAVGASSAPATFTIGVANANGTVNGVGTSNAAEFRLTGGTCLAPLPNVIAAGGACTVQVTFMPAASGVRTATLTISDDGSPNPVAIEMTGIGSTAQSGSGTKVTIVEFYDAALNHYFITPNQGEIALLGKPPFQDWQPTGLAFNGFAPGQGPPGTVGVCRFFNDHFLGISTHFYAPHGLGCEQTIAQFPDWTLESADLFDATLPAADGSCPASSIPVYRMFNNGMGGAPNHRFTTDLAVRQQMIDAGYTPEGAGIGVGWCAPQ